MIDVATGGSSGSSEVVCIAEIRFRICLIYSIFCFFHYYYYYYPVFNVPCVSHGRWITMPMHRL